MNTIVNDLKQQITAEIMYIGSGSTRFRNVMSIMKQSPMNSAVNTNVFQLSVPNSNAYRIIKSFYPLHDDARFGDVSGLEKGIICFDRVADYHDNIIVFSTTTKTSPRAIHFFKALTKLASMHGQPRLDRTAG